MKPRFQPRPRSTSATQKCATLSPDRPTAAAAAMRTRPAAVTRSLPNRTISRPVRKLGPNIARMCHWMPSAASPTAWPHPTIASGAAVMTKLISP